ncbi:MAG TPA: GNAT family N-acetyltransferase, partial [Kofleriaceae bacterium]
KPLASEAVPDCEIDLVTAATLADFTRVMATGWNVDPVSLAALHRQTLGEPRQHHFVAYSAGVTAAAASYIAFDASAFLMGAVVLPELRGRGLYRALVAARLAHARSIGIELATTHAREVSSAPILEKLGFATVCRFAMYLA